jgi:CubicO group peptidase (beta-lactamase class C family)
MALPRRPLQLSLVLGALVVLPGPARPQDSLEASIDDLVRKSGFTDDGPGVAVLVRQPGKVQFAKGYGLANLQDRTPVTPRTLFELASVSKTFTTTAVLILYERGRLSLDDPVRKYLPELPAYRGRPICIRDLLQHVSGLPDYMDLEDVPARHKSFWDNDDYLGQLARQRRKFPLRFAPGAKYEYNNSNFMLLGVIVARASKKSFGAFLHDAVFVPAGMDHSFVYESPAAHAPRGFLPAVGYEKKKKTGVWQPTWGAPPVRQEKMLTVGDGAVWTNLEDMGRWDEALRANKLLRPETMQLALTLSRTADGKTNDYGLGWGLYGDLNRPRAFGHDGSWGGFKTCYHRLLAADRTIVLLSNRGDFDPDKLRAKLNQLLGRKL